MFKVRLLQAILLSSLLAPAAAVASPAVAPAVPPAATTAAAAAANVETPMPEEKPQPSLFEDPQKVETAQLAVRFALPPDARAVDTLSVHPYPMKPPVTNGPASKLPITPKDMKYLLLATGYNARANVDKAYQAGGWRWQYALAEAQRRSHIGAPHTLIGAYSWVDDMTPYMMRECKRWNDFEAERYRRYKRAVEEFEKTRVDVENDAVRQGLSPIPLRAHLGGITNTKIPVGNWWLTATRKKPGLTFYWQIPFTAASGENVNLSLTQANALIITGNW